MGENSKIAWTHHTFNPWWGCTPVSPGCDNCYALTWSKRVGQDCFNESHRRFFDDAYWQKPLKWDRAAQQAGERHRVFCASMADVFESASSMDHTYQRVRLFNLIRKTTNLDWLLLTKRPENILHCLPGDWVRGSFFHNAWLGVTVENQEMANKRIPILLDIPAAVRFVSVEPMLGPVDWKRWIPTGRTARRPDGTTVIEPHFWMTRCERCGWVGSSELCPEYDPEDIICPACVRSVGSAELPSINWVICGGESGPRARPMHPDWVRSLRDQCVSAGAPFFFKQWGGRSKDATLDGQEWRQFPGGGVTA